MELRLRATLIAVAVAAAGCSSVTASDAGRIEHQANDALLVAAIKTKMIAADPDSTTTVGVRVAGGVATLRGAVRTARDRDRIVAAARSTGGVHAVVDQVGVDPRLATIREQASDVALTARIGASVFTQTGSTAVRVSTRRGVVTLSGDVPDSRVRGAALATARDTSGVRAVVDHMHG